MRERYAIKSGAIPLTIRRLAPHLLLLALWLACFAAARLLEYAPHASLWFPPAAITFAGFAVLGLRALPALLLACGLATFATEMMYSQQLEIDSLLLATLAFAFSHTFSYGIAALLLRRMARGQARVATMLRTVTVFLLGGVLAAAFAATSGAFGLGLAGMIDLADVPGLLVPWMIGDYAGLVALAPLATMLLRRSAERSGLHIDLDLPRLGQARAPDPTSSFPLKLALLLGVSSLVLFAAALLPGQPSLVFILFLAVVIQLWIVHTEGDVQAVLAIAAFSLLLAVLVAALDLQAHALTLQFAMISLAANSYFGLAVPELYADNVRLRALLTHDALTGVLSRACFEERVVEALHRASARSQAAALLMIDLDRLKAINDSEGHAAGDAALRAVALRCGDCLRPGDLFGRLSGDEFGAFLAGADLAVARQIADRMREALRRHSAGDDAQSISASFGIAVIDEHTDSYDALLARADREMYRDKRGD